MFKKDIIWIIELSLAMHEQEIGDKKEGLKIRQVESGVRELWRIDFNANRGYWLMERLTRREGARQEAKIETTCVHEVGGKAAGFEGGNRRKENR